MPDASQTNLERTFADLANMRLRDKAPGLLDYLVGFQMIKSEEDGSRAVGMFGFQVGDDWHYAPVFFLNGEIKGLDSLYSVESDLFVPLNEDFINSIINRRPATLGEADDRPQTQRGVRDPDYHRLRTLPPGSGNLGGPGLGKLAHQMITFTKTSGYVDLPEALKMAGPGTARSFIDAMGRSPKIAAATREFYSLMDFEVPKATRLPKVAAEVQIISSVAQAGDADLTDAQRQQILKGDAAVVDTREGVDKAIVYANESKVQMQSPNEPGLYDILMSDGKVRQLLCLPVRGSKCLLVVDPDSDAWGCIETEKVQSLRCYMQQEYREALDKATTEVDSAAAGTMFILANEFGVQLPAFCVEHRSNSVDGVLSMAVHTKDYLGDYGCPGAVSPVFDHREQIDTLIASPNRHGYKLHVSGAKAYANTKCFRAVVLGKAKSDDYGYKWYDCCDREKMFKPGDFGGFDTVTDALRKVAYPLKVWTDDNGFNIQGEQMVRLNKLATLKHLVVDHRMSEADARTVMKTASYQPKRWWVKQAAEMLPFPEITDRHHGGEMSAFHQTETPYEDVVRAGNTNDGREAYEYTSPFEGGTPEGDNTGQVLEQAAATGQKEVFDAAALGSMVKTHVPTEMVERFLPTIVAGMDRLGRLLFLLYWHFDEFSERYGEGEELMDFADNLRNTFESLGDLVIFMKRRTLSGDPEFYGLGLNAAIDG